MANVKREIDGMTSKWAGEKKTHRNGAKIPPIITISEGSVLKEQAVVPAVISGSMALDSGTLSVTGGRFDSTITSTKTGFISGGVYTDAAKVNTSETLLETGKSFVENTEGSCAPRWTLHPDKPTK